MILSITFVMLNWWTRRDSNPHQCGNHGFYSSGLVGDWKRAPVTDPSSEPAPASSTLLADQLACRTWCYPGCRHVNHFWQWRSLLCQRAQKTKKAATRIGETVVLYH
jgi:hypothetical protein